MTESSIIEAFKHPELELADAIHYVLAESDEIVTWNKKLKTYSKKRR